jgi:1-pyrroline-5-carboxylate dehydrogenase
MPQVPAFATADPAHGMTEASPGHVQNLVAGSWLDADHVRNDIIDPMDGQRFLHVPDTRVHTPFIEGLRSCPKSGLHNPHDIADYFTRLIQRVMPKSWPQCAAEVTVTRVFLENFSGDSVRFLGRGFSNPGDYQGQETRGYRWPFGPVVIIAPFNFPLEIPALQVMGALFMGNRPLVKVDSKVSVVFEQFLRLLIHAGLPPTDVDLIHCPGSEMGKLLDEARDDIRMLQFTGSSSVAEHVSTVVNGAVRLEDAGFDWKVFGPDFRADWLDYVAWQSDQDAYSASGQKCSAQSIVFVHENWEKALLPKLAELAARRKLDDLTLGPVLTWTNEKMLAHIDALLSIPDAELLFGGKTLEGHSIPACFGALEATAVRVPLSAFGSAQFELITTELFGPFQIVVTYTDSELPMLLDILERIPHHLTAGVVSNDALFLKKVLGATVNGTTYCGMRGRTTGAPQNHWFGPCGDPRAAGIGTPEAIIATWSGHREIVLPGVVTAKSFLTRDRCRTAGQRRHQRER